MITAKEIKQFEVSIEKGMLTKEYEIFEERDAIDITDKAVRIKVRIDTATEESLERDKTHLQELMDVVDTKLMAIEKLNKEN